MRAASAAVGAAPQGQTRSVSSGLVLPTVMVSVMPTDAHMSTQPTIKIPMTFIAWRM